MIQLSFTPPAPGSPWRKTWDRAKQRDLADITETDLQYKYFDVNVEMIVNDVEAISKTRFVTLVDLSLSFAYSTKRILSGEDAAFGFTESDEVIHLHNNGNLIIISSSKKPWQVSADRKELADAFLNFSREAYRHLTSEFPLLAKNPTIQSFSPERLQ
ncbi:hypothetical protein ACFQ08_02175 [Streptosporangium algeriense]|uniref:Uncharacterized protein n=1 Tax=Streptosporangium algeriense TaxID=1682748 RepID=A0ABW3DK31_9ACTN